MTTMNIEDIRHKKIVPQKYKPNSYRIFCEDIGNQSIANEIKYSSAAPPLYTDPLIVPAQAIEDRNRPHAGNLASFLRENAGTINEPINKIQSRGMDKNVEKRWWEWTLPAEDENWKNKRRSSSQSSAKPAERGSEFQTTYQKEHGYLKNLVNQNTVVGLRNDNQGAANRHYYNPNNVQANGIVPVNDLTNGSNDQQRVFVDRVSFEQNYNSRNENNYPIRGNRQGAFVVNQVEPKPALGTRVRPDSNKSTSVWDAMHPLDNPVGPGTPARILKTQTAEKPYTIHQESRQQRRDPIGYFEDTKFGGSLGTHLSNLNPLPSFNNNIMANTREQSHGNYQPSWNGNGESNLNSLNDQRGPDANELFDNAMMYQQQPIMANYN